MMFALGEGHDVAALRATYAAEGRVRVRDVLAPASADLLRAHLAGRTDWLKVINSGEKLFELNAETIASMSADQRAQLDVAVMNGARDGFQFRYDSIRVADGVGDRARGDLLGAFAHWFSTGQAMEFLAAITGGTDLRFADAQATAYRPGDFLTGHDDAVAGKDRRAAYVLGLTPRWRLEWGGLLLFHGQDQALSGVSPGFNTLDLMAVPQPHSVSIVTPAADVPRHAITGWLRAQPQPA